MASGSIFPLLFLRIDAMSFSHDPLILLFLLPGLKHTLSLFAKTW